MNRFYGFNWVPFGRSGGICKERSDGTAIAAERSGADRVTNSEGRHGGKARADRKRRLGFERAEGQQKAQASQEGGLGQMVGRMRPQLNTK